MGIVNAGRSKRRRVSIFSLPHFCEYFLRFQVEFLHFKNPVKYSGNLQINHRTVHFRAAGGDGAS